MNPEEAAAASMENSVNLEVKLVYNEESDGYELEISDLIGQMAPDTELIIISEVEEPQLILHDDHKAITYIDSSELAALRNIETKKDGKLMNNACNTTIVYTSDNIKHEEIQTDDIKEELIAGVDGAESEVERKPDITNSVVIIDNTNGKLTICNSNNTENQGKSDLGDVKIYVCEYCIETFPTLGGLQKHKRTVHKLPLDCEICGRKFHDPQVFKAHMLLHDLKKTFKCDICQKIFTQKAMWSRHQLLHAGKKSSVCDVCGKTFAHNGYLQKHLLIHSEEKRFKCDLCGKAFIQRGYLKRHMLVHTGERPHECDICHATFTQKHVLDAHLVKHSESKPFICEICSKAFSQKRTLKKHLVSHNEESGDPNNDSSSAEIKIKKNQDGENDKQYVCEICGKAFLYKGSWKMHKVIHLKEKPYSCDICHKTFSFKGNLKTHKAIHLEDRPHKCGVCLKAFAQSGELKRHLLMHTGEKSFLCDICSKAFSHGSYLKKHKLVHRDEKPFKCEFCTKVFSRQGYLKDHMLTHTGEKKFKCECGKAFSRSGYLKRHRVLHNVQIANNYIIQEL